MGAAIWGRNKPKINAYAAGALAVQCVLGQAGQLASGIARYQDIEAANNELNASLAKLRETLLDLDKEISDVTASIDAAPSTQKPGFQEQLNTDKHFKSV